MTFPVSLVGMCALIKLIKFVGIPREWNRHSLHFSAPGLLGLFGNEDNELLLYLPTQMRFPIGRERVTCRGSKLTNSLRKHWTTLVWSDCATWNRGKFVSQPAPSKRFLHIFFFHFWGGRYNKTLNDWSSGKQWILFPLDLNDVEGLRETKLTVSLGASH